MTKDQIIQTLYKTATFERVPEGVKMTREFEKEAEAILKLFEQEQSNSAFTGNTHKAAEQRDKIILAASWKTNLKTTEIDSRLKAFLQYMEHRKRIAEAILNSPLQYEEILLIQFNECNETIKKIIGL
ncbi:MAG: hypothetical protein V4549_07775 [Bacteroidota bacterium]